MFKLELNYIGEENNQLWGQDFEKIETYAVSYKIVTINKILYPNEKVLVNKGFFCEGVSEIAWEFNIDGYQSAQKWLKHRKGSVLKADDIRHYRKIVFTLTETARVIWEIDKVGVVLGDE